MVGKPSHQLLGQCELKKITHLSLKKVPTVSQIWLTIGTFTLTSIIQSYRQRTM
ncbi:hypothetical protein O209_00515 [Lactiplantibacillus plantarum WHE 92]|nr:hypothetical protein O209_00515 [Lactiplantibacillus plantarum WHE 92]